MKKATFLFSLCTLASSWSTTSAFQPGSVKTTTTFGVTTRATTSNAAKSSCALFSKTTRKSKAIPALSATKLNKETELQQPIASNHDDVATSWRKQGLYALRRWMTRLVETLLVAAQQRWRQVVLANNNNNNNKKDCSVTAADASPVKHSFQQLARQTQSHCVALVRRHVVSTDMAAKSIRASRQRLRNVLQQEQQQGTTANANTTNSNSNSNTATTAIKPLPQQSTTPTPTTTISATTTTTTTTTLVKGISYEPKHVKARHEQPKSPAQEAQLQAKYAAIASLEERAFCILIDLGMVQDTTSSWPS